MSEKRLWLNNKRIPWLMQIIPRIVATGFDANISPISLIKSSINLKKRYVIKAGTKNIAR